MKGAVKILKAATSAKAFQLATALLVVVIVISGTVGALHYAGLCSLDAWTILITSRVGPIISALNLAEVSATCPLGFLERSLAVGDLLPQWYFSVGVVVLSIIVLGRVFCAWVCPAGLVYRLVQGKRKLPSKREAEEQKTFWASYSSYAVLGGVLLASFAFRFPVFCFFCPVGLAFATIYAAMKLFTPDPLSVELVLFPIMLGIELWVLKNWCRSFCPLGALFSIIGNLNHFLVPVVNKDKCRTSKGIQCGACERACPEGITLTQKKLFVPKSCTKCLECSDKCPVKAIEYKLFA